MESDHSGALHDANWLQSRSWMYELGIPNWLVGGVEPFVHSDDPRMAVCLVVSTPAALFAVAAPSFVLCLNSRPVELSRACCSHACPCFDRTAGVTLVLR